MKKRNKILFLLDFFLIIAFLAPSLGVASQDKDKDCSKPLWTWILVCNITFPVIIILPSLGFDRDFEVMCSCCGVFFNIFFLVWGIIGLVWAKKSGIKEECGKLYDVTFGDSIAILVFFVIWCIFTMTLLVLSALAAM
ncbi:hypothetical protein M0811_03488 [Anaeramoeba ignava]|uniref:Transmembrane protein n=1 Tax=Anaeramoeba ignava TaxID=1746090 RepID=A0A9Q0L7D5_ANAIG|nr:hypothetical protein M0811_03488 [Anaeramoeba ignava]